MRSCLVLVARDHVSEVADLLRVHGLGAASHHGVAHRFQHARDREGRHDGVEVAVLPDAVVVQFLAERFLVVLVVLLSVHRVHARKLEHDHGRGLRHVRETLVAGLCTEDAHFLGQEGVLGRCSA